MLINPKLIKAVLVTFLIVIGGIAGYQLVTDADTREAEEAFEELQAQDGVETERYDDADVDNFEKSLTEEAVVGAVDGVDYGITFNNSFEHTKPGEYSEIIVDVSNLEPGEFSIMYVRKAGTEDYIEAGGQEHTVDSDGSIKTRFYITEFGDYEVMFSYKGESIVSDVITVK